MKTTGSDTKKVFMKKGTCSQTFMYLSDREFENPKENEERASDPLCGGLMQQGYQCGMLWGASLGAGAEAYRRRGNCGQAAAMAVTATQQILESFTKRTHSANCRDITGCDLSKWTGMAKFMIKSFAKGVTNSHCFNLAEKWAPEAILSAKNGLSQDQSVACCQAMSCASEVAGKMGARDEEIVMVAGFAGGFGLSGNACGALAASIWMRSIAWCKDHPKKNPPIFNNPIAKKILKAFYDTTDSKILCQEICGKKFRSISDHTEFLKSGGCKNVIDVLAQP